MSSSHISNELLSQHALDAIVTETAKQLMNLPFDAREVVIESFSTIMLRGLVPMSGMTMQQHVSASPEALQQLDLAVKKEGVYKNNDKALYAYQFAREATSAGVLPACRDSKGDVYIALICNKRNKEMYNWSAGYTEAPLARWRGKLLSEKKSDIFYDRAKIQASATRTMEAILAEANGDWTKVSYDDYARFQKEFKRDGVVLPTFDINSLHTASRECIEEMSLDLSKFPQRKTFLISYDNTLGISQGDAPGQVSNRSHQYLVYLGEVGRLPDIKPNDDVEIAEWVNVSKITREDYKKYTANSKPICIYGLRGLEFGLKDLWSHLLAQASTSVSKLSGKATVRFSQPENLVAEIECFCNKHSIKIENTIVADFMQYLSGNLPLNTYTGEPAQRILNCMLQTASYLLSPRLKPNNFMEEMNKILEPIARLSTKKDAVAPPVVKL